MSIGLVTIAALLLLLPGVGFIAGVNFADKNVREIVFRNTPAEIGYVILVSVVIHLIFLRFLNFSVARLYLDYEHIQASSGHLALGKVRAALEIALLYFLMTAFAGFGPGYYLGRQVRAGGKWRFFAKHRWMLDLTGISDEDTLYARVLLNHKFSVDGDPTEYMIVIEGIIRDTYFAADGTLLYLVFRSFTELKIPLANPPYIGTLIQAGESQVLSEFDQLVIEGREIAMARYRRIPFGIAEDPDNLEKIAEAIAED